VFHGRLWRVTLGARYHTEAMCKAPSMPQSGWVRMSDLHATGAHHLETADRHQVLHKLAQPLDKVAGVHQPQHLTFLQEAAAVLSFAIFPGLYSCFVIIFVV
jgi:hypothetical protein